MKPKFTPQKFGRYTVHPDGTIESSHGWRGNKDYSVTPIINKDGYLEVRMTENGFRRKWKLHNLICEVFHGPRPSKFHQVCHLDGDKLNNSAANLTWGTPKKNAEHRNLHGRTSKGVRHGKSVSAAVARSRMSDHLISAAPDLYNTLETISNELLAGTDPIHLITIIEQALKKARGDSCL